MSIAISDLDVLTEYIEGVKARSEHASHLSAVLPALLGYVLFHAEQDSLRAGEYEGRTKNVLRFRVSGKTYVLSYNHESLVIDLRSGSLQGAHVASFGERATLQEIQKVFGKL